MLPLRHEHHLRALGQEVDGLLPVVADTQEEGDLVQQLLRRGRHGGADARALEGREGREGAPVGGRARANAQQPLRLGDEVLVEAELLAQLRDGEVAVPQRSFQAREPHLRRFVRVVHRRARLDLQTRQLREGGVRWKSLVPALHVQVDNLLLELLVLHGVEVHLAHVLLFHRMQRQRMVSLQLLTQVLQQQLLLHARLLTQHLHPLLDTVEHPVLPLQCLAQRSRLSLGGLCVPHGLLALLVGDADLDAQLGDPLLVEALQLICLSHDLGLLQLALQEHPAQPPMKARLPLRPRSHARPRWRANSFLHPAPLGALKCKSP
eukprot:scaffold7419_cov210-Pinguiococcus_pyrenoidosus.AAC.1